MGKVDGLGFSTRLRIDLAAIRANYRLIADRVAPAECTAVVKANAYGLGVGKVVPALYREGCRTFFVAQLCEAFDVRDAAGPGSSIFILNGLDPGCEEICAEQGFVPVLNSVSQITRWRSLARAQGRMLPAALQVDSGMSRLGLDWAATADLAADPGASRDILFQLIMTHLACADTPDACANAAQLDLFAAACRLFPGVPASIANSGGVFLQPGFHQGAVRPGIALYGSAPNAFASDVRPVVRLDARIIQIREIGAGRGVGYGLDYVAPGTRRIATVGIGYGDGWPRSLGGRGAVWFDGHRLPVVGRISMDSLAIDITALGADTLREGDMVELLGPSQSLEDVAQDAGAISYEILTRLGARHQRVYVDGDHEDILAPGAY